MERSAQFMKNVSSLPTPSDAYHHLELVPILYVGQLRRKILVFCRMRLCWSWWRRPLTCSLDSRWKRFFIKTAALKSDRSFIGPFLPALFRVRYHRPLYHLYSSGVSLYVMVFFRKFIPLFALLFWPSDCELWFTINWISEKSIVNTCKMSTLRVNFLAASHPRIPSQVVFSLYLGLAVLSTPWVAPLLIT